MTLVPWIEDISIQLQHSQLSYPPYQQHITHPVNWRILSWTSKGLINWQLTPWCQYFFFCTSGSKSTILWTTFQSPLISWRYFPVGEKTTIRLLQYLKKSIIIIILLFIIYAYPSATKISPFDATATEVGLQKCFSSLPGWNGVPRTK